MTRAHFAEGQILFRQGDPADSVCRLLSGAVEILTPTEFLDEIARSPRSARELIQRLSQRLREADDRIVGDESRSGRARRNTDAHSQKAVVLVNNAYLAAKHPWLQRQFHSPLELGNLPFVVGRAAVPG